MIPFFEPSLIVAGTGRVAGHLGLALREAGLHVDCVAGRNEETGSVLARRLQASFEKFPLQRPSFKGVVLVCLRDGAVGEFAQNHSFPRALVLHCSGSLPLEVLGPCSPHRGVLYPFQTFSGMSRVAWSDVPLFTQGSTPEASREVGRLASLLSNTVFESTNRQRAVLHLAGVLTNNFVNHLYHLAGQVLKKEDIPFSVLLPLLSETARKVGLQTPLEAQTGPAVRHDLGTIRSHLEMLAGDPELAAIYQLLTDSIWRSISQTNSET